MARNIIISEEDTCKLTNKSAFQLIFSKWGDHVDHLRGQQDHLLIFLSYNFNLILICHLLSQEAFSVESLTRDPSFTWNTASISHGCQSNAVRLSSFWSNGFPADLVTLNPFANKYLIFFYLISILLPRQGNIAW